MGLVVNTTSKQSTLTASLHAVANIALDSKQSGIRGLSSHYILANSIITSDVTSVQISGKFFSG